MIKACALCSSSWHFILRSPVWLVLKALRAKYALGVCLKYPPVLKKKAQLLAYF